MGWDANPQMLVVPAHPPSSPGDYFPEKSTKHVFDSAPSHSISARTKTFRVDSTPGLLQPSQLTHGMELGGPSRGGGRVAQQRTSKRGYDRQEVVGLSQPEAPITHRPCRIHVACGDGAPHGGQGLPALLLHQGPQQAGQLQRRPAQGKGHPS